MKPFRIIMTKLLVRTTCLATTISCENPLIGDDPANTAENNFEILWGQFDRYYALFSLKGVDWNQVYTDYRPRVTATTSHTELWETVTEMLEILDDSHIELHDPVLNWEYISGFADNDQARREYDIQLIQNKYLGNAFQFTNDGGIMYGDLDKEIGYIKVFDFEREHKDIDLVISRLEQFPAMVVDLRTSRGGTTEGVINISGRFADQVRFVFTLQTRNGPGYDDFDAPTKKYIVPSGPMQYTKPVVVLTDRFTPSAAEHLTILLADLPHVTHIGDSTAGVFSDQFGYKFLPNGWLYTMSYQLALYPDGTTPEGIGVVPDIYIRNTELEIATGTDKVLEFAIEFLM